MTIEYSIGAPLNPVSPFSWDQIPWPKVEKLVQRLQNRIAKAVREQKMGKVRALQRLLSSSFYSKCLAVKKVVQSKGSNTPGIDGVVWRTPKQKMKAVCLIKRRGYRPQPLKRIYISKKDGRLRPLSIPTLQDRAQQALWKLALEPIAEVWADINAYGFRIKRSAADAIAQCHIVLSQKVSAPWILEGDIEACFDRISHSWLIENIPMDKTILRKFLKAGFMEGQKVMPTTLGTPQGGVISPTLALMALSGLERYLRSRFKSRSSSKVNIIAYCDDFIITAATKERLQEEVIPMVERFLKERGLTLSHKKTKVTHIKQGFDFLGHHIRRYSCGKVIITPSAENKKRLIRNLGQTVKSLKTEKAETVISSLNPKIRGFCNYFRHVASSKVFTKIDYHLYHMLARWAYRRHPNKSKSWALRKYFKSHKGRNWVFMDIMKRNGEEKKMSLYFASKTPIRRHIKIKGEAHPFDPAYKEYFKRRKIAMNILWSGVNNVTS